ncbi:MAG: hypothetical protein M4579_000218 [Chaenotheca gracillima]|nr:MAG: hypothetical protein M4579_000218 [Chaenotheca gracillima]
MASNSDVRRAGIAPAIPLRTSSRATILQQRLELKKSMKDVKRKISNPSSMAGSEPHYKLQIEEIENEKAQIKLDQEDLLLQRGEKLLTLGGLSVPLHEQPPTDPLSWAQLVDD